MRPMSPNPASAAASSDASTVPLGDASERGSASLTAAARPLVRRVLRPYGARLSLWADDRRFFDACAPALARYPRGPAGTGGPDLTICARTGVDSPDDPAWPRTAVDHGDRRLVLHCGSARMEADAGAGTADLVVPPALLGVDDAVRMFVEGAVATLLISGGWLHAVHAALVQLDGRWLLLRGPSGAGKSTLTYACLRAGAAVCSDDWVYGVVGSRPDRLWGYPWRLFLVPEATHRWDELRGAPSVLHPGADRLKVPIVPPRPRRRRGGPVDAVVLLDPSPSLGLRSVSRAEAAERFWGPALPTERRDLPPAWVDELLDRPSYVLARGTDPDDAVSLLRRELVSRS